VLVFGSYETGLYTPASDTDIVVCGAGLNDPTKGNIGLYLCFRVCSEAAAHCEACWGCVVGLRLASTTLQKIMPARVLLLFIT
jgi:hypothetical protein